MTYIFTTTIILDKSFIRCKPNKLFMWSIRILNQNISEVDVLKKDMSFALRKLKSMADVLRHNMDEEKIQINYAEGNAIKNIQDFVTLYVYSASIL